MLIAYSPPKSFCLSLARDMGIKFSSFSAELYPGRHRAQGSPASPLTVQVRCGVHFGPARLSTLRSNAHQPGIRLFHVIIVFAPVTSAFDPPTCSLVPAWDKPMSRVFTARIFFDRCRKPAPKANYGYHSAGEGCPLWIIAVGLQEFCATFASFRRPRLSPCAASRSVSSPETLREAAGLSETGCHAILGVVEFSTTRLPRRYEHADYLTLR